MPKYHKSRKQSRRRLTPKPNHRGGAIYTFDLNDKIGGLPARIPLNGTQDGDCPATDTTDLGFVNYGMTRGQKGGRRRKSRAKTRGKSRGKSRKIKKSGKHTRKH